MSFREQSKTEGLKGLHLTNFVGEFHHTQIWFKDPAPLVEVKQPEGICQENGEKIEAAAGVRPEALLP